jgi:hypothetical protein
MAVLCSVPALPGTSEHSVVPSFDCLFFRVTLLAVHKPQPGAAPCPQSKNTVPNRTPPARGSGLSLCSAVPSAGSGRTIRGVFFMVPGKGRYSKVCRWALGNL